MGIAGSASLSAVSTIDCTSVVKNPSRIPRVRASRETSSVEKKSSSTVMVSKARSLPMRRTLVLAFAPKTTVIGVSNTPG